MIDQLFGSKTRVKLLHLFLNNPGRSFYVREITRKIDEQINSVRRELANMLNIGIISSDGANSSDNANNRLYYEVSQTYQYYKPLRAIFANEKLTAVTTNTSVEGDWLKRLKPLGAVKIAILSGKMVRGAKNDVDLLLAGDLNRTQVNKFVKELEEQESTTLNFTVMSYEDFYYRLSIKDFFVLSIVSGKKSILIDTEHILTEET
jgi:predicted transcriptional regulator